MHWRKLVERGGMVGVVYLIVAFFVFVVGICKWWETGAREGIDGKGVACDALHE